ncbi:sulfatase [Tistrella bauzanensis]|uniref:Sulfatase n=1 Tax=Tistrella bauzanensis TaxID=657419 RepID=A0ABQ1J4X4_9PROT|nr:alkaline phosphatase family protein [Tistrella bauzanensis]GGB60174.1 sulfatase [Tistrella bauzanensis]
MTGATGGMGPRNMQRPDKGRSDEGLANVLLVVVDQWRGDWMPADGGGPKPPRLPALERLMREGTTFRRHYAQATPCGPSRASLLTGMYAMNHRVVQNRVPMAGHITNLGQEVRRAGHMPALVGYTSWMPDPRVTPAGDPRYRMLGANMPGWTVLASLEEPDFEQYFGHLRRNGVDLPEDPFDIWRPTDGIASQPAAAVPRRLSDTAWATDAALDHIAGRRRQPWFLHLGYWRPHPPFLAPEPYDRLHAPDRLPAPVARDAGGGHAHPYQKWLAATTRACDFVQGAPGLAADLDDAAVMRLRGQYAGLMTEIDDHLGRVLDHLDRTGEIDRTLIVFTSDHGEMLGDHRLFGKLTHHDAAFHVPLVVRDPRAPGDARGRVVDAFTESVDVMPTILDWLDLPVPMQCDGASLLAFCRGGTVAGWRDAAHFEFDFSDPVTSAAERALGLSSDLCGLAVLRGQRFKYVHFAGLPPLLFDMVADPHERRDLAGDPDHAAVALDCAQRLLSWRLAHADRSLTRYRGSPDGLTIDGRLIGTGS